MSSKLSRQRIMYGDCSPGWTGDLSDNKEYSVGYSLELPTEYPTNYTEASEWLGELGKPVGAKRVSEFVTERLASICGTDLLVVKSEKGRVQGITALCWLMLSHPTYGFIYADDRGKWMSQARNVFAGVIESLKSPQVGTSTDLFEDVEVIEDGDIDESGDIILAATDSLGYAAESFSGPGVAMSMPDSFMEFADRFGEYQADRVVARIEQSFQKGVKAGIQRIASKTAAATKGGMGK